MWDTKKLNRAVDRIASLTRESNRGTMEQIMVICSTPEGRERARISRAGRKESVPKQVSSLALPQLGLLELQSCHKLRTRVVVLSVEVHVLEVLHHQ